MKNLAMAGLIAVGSCSSTPYQHYWLDVSDLSLEQASKIELISGHQRYRDLDGRECWVDGTPRCVVLFDTEWAFAVQEVATLKEELAQCRGRQ